MGARLAVLAATVWAAACGAPDPSPDALVVATVGEEAILAADFARSFELGFPHLKRGPDPRRAYLDHMVAEALLAQEGYRLRLDTTAAVRGQLADLEDELLVEQVFEREVNRRVSVSDAEVQQVLQEDAVRVRLRYIPAGTLDEARSVRATAEAEGFDAALARQLAARADVELQPEDFVTPFLSPAELPAPVLDAIRDLPVGTPSAPIAAGGQYLVVEVADVQREPVGLDAEARTRARQTLEQQRAKALAREYVTGRMEPVGLTLKGGAFRALTDALWEWVPTLAAPPLSLASALATDPSPAADAVRARLGDVVATTVDGELTAGDLLRRYPSRRYPLSTDSRDAFQGSLYDAVGLTLRDEAFTRQARAQGWDEMPEVAADLRRWRDKWVYQAMVDYVADTTTVSDADVAAYRQRHEAYYDGLGLGSEALAAEVRADARRAKARGSLPRVVAALRERYPVAVDAEALAAAVPDDVVTPGLPVMLYKAHTGRPLYPIADPAW
ncbi:hypothetical protein [Rubrivirga marina]|uniref:peptidylprolyl isomerase n=1 Tax=Rubrivirga marina TaxID=1196024 RepID=A0A271IXC3_9BACT|nr:hypothetical protein [Rubrivirga marina]PAP75365.1 hypothetical protein BSZ37_02345 [Rubrivirga marina]